MKSISIGPDLTVANDAPLTVIAGPCQLEGHDHAFRIAEAMADARTHAGAGIRHGLGNPES
ncbi:MAG: hypothetical protein AAFY59_18970, partial [Pseudomonadota bacterium]